MKNNKRKLIAWKMGHRDKNDSNSLKKFTRLNPETGRPLFEMPEGKYRNIRGKYIKQKEHGGSIIHG